MAYEIVEISNNIDVMHLKFKKEATDRLRDPANLEHLPCVHLINFGNFGEKHVKITRVNANFQKLSL